MASQRVIQGILPQPGCLFIYNSFCSSALTLRTGHGTTTPNATATAGRWVINLASALAKRAFREFNRLFSLLGFFRFNNRRSDIEIQKLIATELTTQLRIRRKRFCSDSCYFIVTVGFFELGDPNAIVLKTLIGLQKLIFICDREQNQMRMFLVLARGEPSGCLNRRMTCLNGLLRRREVLSNENIQVNSL